MGEKGQLNTSKLSWLNEYSFASTINLPPTYYVHDFTQGSDPIPSHHKYSIGRYNEVRKDMYESALFLKEKRNIHMGIDIAAPIGEKVYLFYDGEIIFIKNNTADGDYGPTIITQHIFPQATLYVLFGHLSLDSLKEKKVGQNLKQGDVIGTIGSEDINGGWFPHLHFQLSLQKPDVCDMPGVVAKEQVEQALKTFPDPRLILGPLY